MITAQRGTPVPGAGAREDDRGLPAGAFAASYGRRLAEVLSAQDWSGVEQLAEELRDCWATGRQVFMCGNGGSAANAIHLANDFLYAISKTPGSGLRVHSLAANAAVVTCLANDEGYKEIFSLQLGVLARRGDVLVVFSGSGNSPNILRTLEHAREMGVKSYGILGFSGGKALELVDVPIHVQVNDMQIAEDMQVIIGHALMQWLSAHRPVDATA